MAIIFGVARKILKRKKERERRKEREKCKFRSGQRYVRGISSFEFSWPADVETRHVTCKFSSSRDQLYEGKGKLNIATSRGSSSRLKGEKKGRRGKSEILTIFDRGEVDCSNDPLTRMRQGFIREFVKRDVTSLSRGV